MDTSHFRVAHHQARRRQIGTLSQMVWLLQRIQITVLEIVVAFGWRHYQHSYIDTGRYGEGGKKGHVEIPAIVSLFNP